MLPEDAGSAAAVYGSGVQQFRRFLIATGISTTLLSVFLFAVGALSPAEWEVHARTLTPLDAAEVAKRLLARDRWEEVRGPATSWTRHPDGVDATWGAGGAVVVSLRETSEGVSFAQQLRGSEVSGEFAILEAGDVRDVRFTLRGRAQGGSFDRLVLRFERSRFADRAQLELSGLLAPEPVAGVARGRRLDRSWGCEGEACAVVRLVEPLELAGTDVRVQVVSTAPFLCVATPLEDPAMPVPCSQERGDPRGEGRREVIAPGPGE
jgi:hypothetical protein